MVEDFDKIYVVSDLHLGGPPGRRAFREAAALTNLIRRVREQCTNLRRVALVLNGDIVDFLAAGPDAPEFNPRPQAFLREMAADAEYAPIFEELSKLVQAENWHLVLQLGNHDIELALPSAQQALLELFRVKDDATRSRVLFETSGEGWTCQVGNRRVHVVHGNAWDPWNIVDHDGLEKAARGPGSRTLRPPKTNAGTTMVCHLINRIKVDQPFVDLLKPEDAPLMAVLAAVDAPTSVLAFAKALVARLPEGEYGELLGAGGGVEEPPIEGPEGDMVQFLSSLASDFAIDSSAALQRAEEHLQAEKRVRELVDDDTGHLRHFADYGRAKWQQLVASVGRVRGRPAAESLRRALKRWLTPDVSFNLGALSDIDLRILDVRRPGIDLVIAGHTHLPRLTPRYINTGTWMRVLKLNGSKYLDNEANFKAFFEVVSRKHTLTEIDKLGIDPRQRPVAVVDAEGAELCSVQDDGSLKPIA